MSFVSKRSILVYHFEASSCGSCGLEFLELFTPDFDAERHGIRPAASIRHADCMLVTGAVSFGAVPLLKRIYSQAPRPFSVIAAGACALDEGIFRGSYNVAGPLDRVIPVDVYIPGCPPRPEALLSGILKIAGKSKGKVKGAGGGAGR